jgi:hypothetical protein
MRCVVTAREAPDILNMKIRAENGMSVRRCSEICEHRGWGKLVGGLGKIGMGMGKSGNELGKSGKTLGKII